MAIRNKIFSWFNRSNNIMNVDIKFQGLKHSYRNTDLYQRSNLYTKLEQHARLTQNSKIINRSKMNEFERMEDTILEKYEHEGRNDPNVDPKNIVHQLDRIEVLRKLKIIEDNKGEFNEEEAQCLKLIARVHLEEPKIQMNM